MWDLLILGIAIPCSKLKTSSVYILNSKSEAKSAVSRTESSPILICLASLASICSWLLLVKLVAIYALHRSSLQQLTLQFSTSAPWLFTSSLSIVHLLVIAWQSRASIPQSFHSRVVLITFRVPRTSKTCASNVKQESNSPCSEQIFPRSFLPCRFETNSGSMWKHLFGDGRAVVVGIMLDFGRFGVGTGWLQ